MAVEIGLGLAAFLLIILGGIGSAAVILGAIFGILPDLENMLWKLGVIREDQKVFPGHRNILVRHGREMGRGSIYFQAVFSIAILSLLIWRGV